MPFMETRTAATYAKEILRTVNGSEIAENSVVDGTLVPLNVDNRRILETGQVMVWIAGVGSKVKPAPSSGIIAADVAGIVMHTTELWPGPVVTANLDDASVALWTKNCNFDTSKLLSYSSNAAAIATAMTGGGNGRCGNCVFST